MTTYLRKHFGKRPQGCWIPFYVWEQHLAASLFASDINYTFLSQSQFIKAGMSEDQLFYPSITEDQGKSIIIFPVSLSLENELKEKSFSHVFNELNRKFEANQSEKNQTGKSVSGNTAAVKIVSVFPDKVSSFPDEAEDTVWNRFFEEISLSKNIIETILPSKIIKSFNINQKSSFPDSSAFEHQADYIPQPHSAANGFSPRRFIIDHDEVNGIYSKMIFTNVLINQLKGDKPRKLNAREELWKAQDSYLFSPGDGYLRSEIRKAAYSSLIRAEQLSKEKGKTVSSLIQYDFDFDGIKEFLFQDTMINCYIQQKGASLFELDYLPKEWNYLDSGSDSFGRKTSFADIILPVDSIIDDTDKLPEDNKRLCFNEQYEADAQDKKGKLCFKLSSAGDNIPFGYLEINKCYMFKKDSVVVSYIIKNTGRDLKEFIFIPELNFSFAGIGDEYVRFYAADTTGRDIHLDKTFKTNNLKILDVKNEVQIVLASVKIFCGCFFPVFKKNYYQATKIYPGFSISLKNGETWNNEFSLKFSH